MFHVTVHFFSTGPMFEIMNLPTGEGTITCYAYHTDTMSIMSVYSCKLSIVHDTYMLCNPVGALSYMNS